MKFTFDPAKDQSNREKHGVSLQDAGRLEWDDALIELDNRSNYGEVREVGYVPLADRLYVVIFTRRENSLRIISLRKANSREIKYYANQI
ncbi:MAG: BrnT family toxin [Burkholderiales bacterium]|nr:BrnT family toxin [Burkholderiales bacterium]